MKKLLVGATLLVTTAIVVKKGAKKNSKVNLTLGKQNYESIKVNDDFIKELMERDAILPEHLNISKELIKRFNV